MSRGGPQKAFAEKLERLTKEHIAADAAQEAAAEYEPYLGTPDPDIGKVFNYDKECAILDSFLEFFIKTGLSIKAVDFSDMRQRQAHDDATWEAWLDEDTVRQAWINEAYTAEGRTPPSSAESALVLANSSSSEQMHAPKPGLRNKKKTVRFVLPGDAEDPWYIQSG